MPSPSIPVDDPREPAAGGDGTAGPITVSVRRAVAPDHAINAQAWMQTGMSLASRFEGFLGCGWIRDGLREDLWHVLYRFATPAELDAWERSRERDAWLASGATFAKEVERQHRTGMEGWFDEPRHRAAEPVTGVEGATIDGVPVGEERDAEPAPAPPPWKQAVVIYLGFLPCNLVLNLVLALSPEWLAIELWVRLVITTTILTPLMTFLVLPAVTRLLKPWLAVSRSSAPRSP